MRWLLAACLLFAGCQTATIPEPAAQKMQSAVPDWMPPNFIIDQASTTVPVFNEPTVTFEINRTDCPVRNCAGNKIQTTISTGKVWQEAVEWELDQRYLFSFEFWIEPEFDYQGYQNRDAKQTDQFSSHISIARWHGAGDLKNQLFDLKVDATRGVTFMGKVCIPPSEFGGWHRFNMRIRWANDDTGFLEVRCDGSLHEGLPIFAANNFPTNQALHCFKENNCEPGVEKSPRNFNMQLGLILDPVTTRAKQVSPRIPSQGLSVKMRRILVRRLYVIFGRVEEV